MNKLQKLQLWADKFWSAQSINEAATTVLHESAVVLQESTFDKVALLKNSPRAEPETVRGMRALAHALQMPFTEAAFTLLALPLMANSPAWAKMYVVALKVRQYERGIDLITVPALLEMLDNRIIGARDMETAWRAQKPQGSTAAAFPFVASAPLMDEFATADDFAEPVQV